jgi:hypothetical protein
MYKNDADEKEFNFYDAVINFFAVLAYKCKSPNQDCKKG